MIKKYAINYDGISFLVYLRANLGKIFISFDCISFSRHPWKGEVGVWNSEVGVNYSAFAVRKAKVGVNYSAFGERNAKLRVNYSALRVRKAKVGVNYSALGVRKVKVRVNYSAFGVRKAKVRVNYSEVNIIFRARQCPLVLTEVKSYIRRVLYKNPRALIP